MNDRTAGPLLHAVLKLGYKISQEIRIVGIDDVEYARLLPVPLTTIHQPCREIGQAALAAMFDRIEQPSMLPRDVVLDCKVVVRNSCGVPSEEQLLTRIHADGRIHADILGCSSGTME